MRNISKMIADTLDANGVIQNEDIDICKYGLDIFISSALEIISILIIALIGGNFVETFLFFAAFIPLRVYAGGYHADTRLKCYLISLGVYAFFSVIMNILPKEIFVALNIILSTFSLIVVFAKAPVVHENKAMNYIELEHYRKFSIRICLVETLIVLLLTAILPESLYAVSLAMGQVAVALSMVAAIIKRKVVDNEIKKLSKKGGVINEKI